MNKERLLLLADFVEKLPEEKFDMSSWTNKTATLLPLTDPIDLHACGTTACMMGWATAIPEFKTLGLKLDKLGWPSIVDDLGHTLDGMSAAEYLFDITPVQAAHLFAEVETDEYGYEDENADSRNDTPREAAARIRALVEKES